MALFKADTLRSNNIDAYGIAIATEIAGHKSVKTLSDLFSISDAILSASGNNTNDDAIGQQWYVADEDKYYKLISWSSRKSVEGWKEDNEGLITQLAGIQDLIKNGATVEEAKAALQALGDDYKDLYSLASLFKNFLDLADTSDETINSWKEIEGFLTGITDTETLTGLLQDLKNSIQTETEIIINSLKVKDVDGKTIIKDENGVIRVYYNINGDGSIRTEVIDSTVRPVITNFHTSNGKLNVGNLTSIYNGLRDINENANNLVTERALAKHLNEVNADIQSNTDQITVLSGQLLILTTGAKVTGSCSPNVIYKNAQTNVTVTGTFNATDTSLIPKKMTLLHQDQELAVSEDSKTVQFVESINTTSNNKTYNVRAEVDPNNTGSITVLTATFSFNARYPIYYGFGNSPYDIINSGTKVGPTTSANRTYTATNNNDFDCYFYILVPTDIGTPTKFSMGGAPANMNTASETLNNVAYKVIRSGGIYAPGAKVEITAS